MQGVLLLSSSTRAARWCFGIKKSCSKPGRERKRRRERRRPAEEKGCQSSTHGVLASSTITQHPSQMRSVSPKRWQDSPSGAPMGRKVALHRRTAIDHRRPPSWLRFPRLSKTLRGKKSKKDFARWTACMLKRNGG